MNKPKILILDIETSPIISYTWGLFDQNVALNQVKEDWTILAVSAKWLGEDKVHYFDTSQQKNVRDDSKLLKEVWNLLDECDILVGQNSKNFDTKKLNARFVLADMPPPSSFKHIDTCLIAKSKFNFTSNKLEYLSDKINKKYKKLVNQREFNGFDLWKACLAKNKRAWAEMKKYNKYDVLATEELYTKLIPWDSSINFSLYNDESTNHTCSCGSTDIRKNGFCYTSVGKYQRYSCSKCGREVRDRQNLFSKDKRKSIKASTSR